MIHIFGLKNDLQSPLYMEPSEKGFYCNNNNNSMKGGRDVEKTLLDLRVICISHMHADHHLGLIEILKARAKLIKVCSTYKYKCYILELCINRNLDLC